MSDNERVRELVRILAPHQSRLHVIEELHQRKTMLWLELDAVDEAIYAETRELIDRLTVDVITAAGRERKP